MMTTTLDEHKDILISFVCLSSEIYKEIPIIIWIA
jgi:hypothetical protein